MTDGLSAAARDAERAEANARIEFEIRRFALGERSLQQRERVLAAARNYDELKGKGLFTSPSGGYKVADTERRLKKFEENDKAAWAELIIGWKEQNQDFFGMLLALNTQEDRELYARCSDWYQPEGYRAMRAAAPFDPDSEVVAIECGRMHEVKRERLSLFAEEASKRDWRTHADKTGDVYALIVGPGEMVDLVWITHNWLDMTNCTPDVRLGPERSRLANSKKHAV